MGTLSSYYVVLYDIDISLENNNKKGLLLSLRPQDYVRLIYGYGQDNEEDPILSGVQPAGDRIGSVITDQNGQFKISYDDSAFKVHDNEARPDLILLVIAPDRQEATFNDEGFLIAIGTPERMRIMHMTVYPLRNVGRQEQVIIRISANALKKFSIGNSHDVSRSFVAQVSLAEKQRAKLYRSFSKNLKLDRKIQQHRKIRQATDDFVLNLSAVPMQLRNSEFFANRGSDIADIYIQARTVGVERLKPHSDPKITAAHLRLSEEDLRSLGITEAFDDFRDRLNDGETSFQIDPHNFCMTMQQKIGGTELLRVTGLSDAKQAEAKDRLDKISGEEVEPTPEPGDGEEVEPTPEPGDGEGDSFPAEPEISAEEKIKQIVLEQVKALTLDIPDSKQEKKDQAELIRNSFSHLCPPSSPADVTAFHDVNHLQIAFPDVWAEAFDRDVTDLVRDLHIEYRNHDDDITDDDGAGLLDIEGIDPRELQDLKDYTDLLHKLGADIEAIGNASEPPDEVSNFFARSVDGEIYYQAKALEIKEIWPRLSIEQQQEIYELATMPEPSTKTSEIESRVRSAFEETITALLQPENDAAVIGHAVSLLREVKLPPQEEETTIPTRSERLSQARLILANPAGRVTRVQQLLAGLAQRLSEAHSFRIFQKNSINFGIITAYRQEWKPEAYQVADLVSTITLAPGETRKYTKKQSIKKARARKENERHASTLSDERAITSRAVSDIIEKANKSTNFSQTVGTDIGGKILGFDVGLNTSSQFQHNQSVESERIKKGFHEAIRKASQEFKDERAIEVSTEDAYEVEFGSTSEISNPNNEITVTYLFYELERRYRVTEHLHRLTPIIMVAQEVPNPADIDEDWLMAHEWILRRSLLDSSFHEALDFVSEGLVKDEVVLEIARQHYETQKALTEDLGESVESLDTLQETLRNTLVQTSEQEKLARIAKKRRKKRRRSGRLKKIFGVPSNPIKEAGQIASGASSLAFGNSNDDPAVLEARREALETRLEFLEGTLEDTRSQFTRANSALERATEELSIATQESFTKKTGVSQLRNHIKDNILHYMQAIWTYEKPDQRFFRLYDLPVEIPVPESSGGGAASTTADFTINPQPEENFLHPNWLPGMTDTHLNVNITLPPPSTATESKRLHQIADLDNLVGFKGNYMMFPLKECTYITDFMMQDYVDDYFGIREPDPVSGYSTEELLTYAEQVWHHEDTTDEMREALNNLIQQRLTSPRLDDEMIVVPTGQLFIEALKGEHALLENFKEQHRAMDMLKVQEEVRAERLENLRRAARLVGGDPLLDDPDVDKKIIVEGSNSTHVEA